MGEKVEIEVGPPGPPFYKCPKCWVKGWNVTGVIVDAVEFKRSLYYVYRCPRCKYRWTVQIMKDWIKRKIWKPKY